MTSGMTSLLGKRKKNSPIQNPIKNVIPLSKSEFSGPDFSSLSVLFALKYYLTIAFQE